MVSQFFRVKRALLLLLLQLKVVQAECSLRDESPHLLERFGVAFCDVVIEHEPCCYLLHFSSISTYVSLFFINMKLKTVDVLLVVMRARRTENLKMTMKRSKVVQSMRRRKIMHWTSKVRVKELRRLVKEASLVWTSSALWSLFGAAARFSL